MIFDVKSFPKIYDFIGGQNGPLVITPPQKKYLPPPIRVVRGSGGNLISPPNSHFIGVLESVKILGVLYKLSEYGAKAKKK